MPPLKTYRLFISHSWTYTNSYEKLVEMFDKQSLFKWHNYSVPQNDPVHNAKNDRELYEAIKRQIRPVNCVVILAGVYSSYSKWINHEIQIATRELRKPIIAIEPWGAERTSKIVKDNATEVVKWNSASIVAAIRNNSI